MGKSTISMAMFNSKLLNYQRVYPLVNWKLFQTTNESIWTMAMGQNFPAAFINSLLGFGAESGPIPLRCHVGFEWMFHTQTLGLSMSWMTKFETWQHHWRTYGIQNIPPSHLIKYSLIFLDFRFLWLPITIPKKFGSRSPFFLTSQPGYFVHGSAVKSLL